MKHDITKYLLGTFLGVFLVIGVGYVSANYTAPLSNPPTCVAGNPGCDAPIHVGASQSKFGSLDITGPASFIRAAVGSFREVRLGTHLNIACDASAVGHIRYNAGTVEYCDGLGVWKTFASGSGTFAASCPAGQVLQAFNGTAPTCVAGGGSTGPTNLTNYSQLPSGSLAGYCTSNEGAAETVVAPAIDRGGQGCGCTSGWTRLPVEGHSYGDEAGVGSDSDITCIKN